VSEENTSPPRPWRVVRESTGPVIVDANGDDIGKVYFDRDAYLADAALIVRAVIMHDELVEALETVVKWADLLAGKEIPGFLEDARELIKRAKGGP